MRAVSFGDGICLMVEQAREDQRPALRQNRGEARRKLDPPDAHEEIELGGYIMERACPHRQADLTVFGEVEGTVLICTLHGWKFDLETGDGKNMVRYSELLQKSVRAIQSTFQKRDLGNLFSGRGAKVTKVSERPVSTDDFELITWLVIR